MSVNQLLRSLMVLKLGYSFVDFFSKMVKPFFLNHVKIPLVKCFTLCVHTAFHCM